MALPSLFTLKGYPEILRLFRLLHPGIGLKRWLLLASSGIAIWSVGITFFARQFISLRNPDFLTEYAETPFAILLLISGGLAIVGGLAGLYKTLSPLIIGRPTLGSLGETLYTRRSRERGPRIVTIGGGTGMSVLLQGLKHHTDNLTAIIGVGDDGGSSGRLRRELGVLPPGDFRNCIVAMSDEESLLPKLLQYRFTKGNGLEGHSFGNLFLVAMSHITYSFEEALSESSKVLAVRGAIAPATTENIRLSAKLTDGTYIEGESNITSRGGIVENLYIDPPTAQAYVPAVEAILEADVLVLGPGSLYTSILPNLMVSGISKAIMETKATRIYACNVATEMGETQGYDVSDHIAALQQHTNPEIVDWVIVNNNILDIGNEFKGESVHLSSVVENNPQIAEGDIVDIDHPVRHDPHKLAKLVLEVYEGKVSSTDFVK